MIVPDPHNEAIDALILAIDDGLGEDDGIVGMACTVRDPELLGQSRWRVNLKFLSLGVIDSRRLHLWRIVTIAELSEAEAPHVFQIGDFLHER